MAFSFFFLSPPLVANLGRENRLSSLQRVPWYAPENWVAMRANITFFVSISPYCMLIWRESQLFSHYTPFLESSWGTNKMKIVNSFFYPHRFVWDT